MKPAVALLVLLLCGCARGANPSGPAEPEPPPTPVTIVQAGKGVVEQYKQAYQVRSLEALSAVYSHDLDVSLVHQGEAHHGWTAVETYLRDKLVRAAEVRLKLTDVTVLALGQDAASVLAKMRRDINDGDTTITEEGYLTLALRREPGPDGARWVIASEHFSFR
ncbi:MAG TPA: nuclear transport factor 2 family protein [Kofleriaceae bacterium]|nr:nuclear transport factor 2 family protein [Kofleriaceae bacterium]